MKYSPEFVAATRAELDRLVAPIRDAWPAVVGLVDVLHRAGVDVDLPDLTAPQERRAATPVDGASVRSTGDTEALPSPAPAAPTSSSQATAPPAPTAPTTPPTPPAPASPQKKRKPQATNPGADKMRALAAERDEAFYAATPEDGSWISLADIRAKIGGGTQRATAAKASLLDAGRIVENDRQRAAYRVRRNVDTPPPGDVSKTPLVGVAAQRAGKATRQAAKARATTPEAAVRDAIVELSQKPAGMTRAQLQKKLGLDKDTAIEYLRRYIDRGVIRPVPDERDGGEARYRYVQPSARHTPSSRPRQRPDVAAAALRAAGLPVPGTGHASGANGKVTNDKNIQQFLDECAAAGGTYEAMNGGHIRVTGPKGFSVIAKTSGSSGLARTRASVKTHTGLAV